MSLAIFDLDNTLIAGDSDHAWGEFLIQNQIVDPVTYRQSNDLFFKQYQDGSLNIDEYLEFALKPLANKPISTLKTWHAQFMADYVEPMRLPLADKLLRDHRQAGDYLLIITATNLFITEPIAELLGVDEILATNLEIKNGVYTGKSDGTPCFQNGKVSRLRAWLKDSHLDLAGSYFYSDSINDLPLLELVDNPFAVDPDEKLAEHAKIHNWPIMSLRHKST